MDEMRRSSAGALSFEKFNMAFRWWQTLVPYGRAATGESIIVTP